MNLSSVDAKALIDVNRLFGANSIRELAVGEISPALSSIKSKYLGSIAGREAPSFRDMFNWAQCVLAKSYQTEYYYKSVLLQKLVTGIHSPRSTAVFSEFKVGKCRADLVLVNDVATVYEVKTGLDDLKKASRQVGEYFKCFSRVIFVIDPVHLKKATEILPDSVGIACITQRKQLRILRQCDVENACLSSEEMFLALRRDEYERVVRSNFPEVDLKNYKSILACIGSMRPEEMQLEFNRILRKRGLSSSRLHDISKLPPSLLPAAYLYKMSSKEWNGLIQVLDMRVKDALEQSL